MTRVDWPPGARAKGLALILTLLIGIKISIILLALVALAPRSLNSSGHFLQRQASLEAAELGVSYALSRLENDPEWRGGEEFGQIVNLADGSLTVVEDRGNVIGLMRTPDGVSQFRLRFNFQDGSGGEDEREDPQAENRLDLEQLSTNNLRTSNLADIFVSDSSGVRPSGKFAGPGEIYLVVEGRSGRALRESRAQNPNAKPLVGATLDSALLQVSVKGHFGEGGDAALMAAGDLDVVIGKPDSFDDGGLRQYEMVVNSLTKGSPPKVRTKGRMDLRGYVKPGVNYKSRGSIATADGTVGPGVNMGSATTTETESPTSGFYKLDWDQVRKADPNPLSTQSIGLKSGCYVVWDDRSLHYYDQDYQDYRSHITANPNDPGRVISRNFNEVRTNASQVPDGISWTESSVDRVKLRIKVEKNIAVQATSSSSDFAFFPREGFVTGPPGVDGVVPGEDFAQTGNSVRSGQVQFQFSPPRGSSSILSGPGNMIFGTTLKGTGSSITSAKSILVAPGTESQELSANEELGVSMYAKENIQIYAYKRWNDGQQGAYTGIRISGVLYAWQDISLVAGLEDGDQVQNGFSFHNKGRRVKLTGAVVAYGGNPGDAQNGDPGVGLPSQGQMKICGSDVHLTYDSSYLGTLSEEIKPTSMGVVDWTWRE